MDREFLEGRLLVRTGDITQQTTDVIVNAANSTLLGGGGVDYAIHKAGGPQILEECQQIRRSSFPDGLPTGEVVATTAGNMAAKAVFHTVGPIYGNEHGRESQLLESCYRKSVELAMQSGYTSISFPAISTGVYAFPREKAAQIVSRTIVSLLHLHPEITVTLVFFSEKDTLAFLLEHATHP